MGRVVKAARARTGSAELPFAGRAPDNAIPPVRARVPPRPQRYKNNAERDYAVGLEAQRRAGVLREWHYEAIRLRVGGGAFYTPDFLVVTASGEVQVHEVKGHMREAARVRMLAVLDRYPFRVFVNGKEWAG